MSDRPLDLDLDDAVASTGDPVVDEARRAYRQVAEWESTWRPRFVADLRFRHGDSDNGYQWPANIRSQRDLQRRPCLTMNIVAQHNYQITNPRKRAKIEPSVVAVGNGATAESAAVFRDIMRDIQYNSRAQQAYKLGGDFQVDGGIGYWRIITDYLDDRSMDQEIFIEPVIDPLSVFMDPDIKMPDGSDAKFCLIEDVVPKAQFRKAYPRLKHLISSSPLGLGTNSDWMDKHHVRVCEYFRKSEHRAELLSFVDPVSGQRKHLKTSEIPTELRDAVRKHELTLTRDVWETQIEWFLIVGEQVVDQTTWLGKYIPVVRCPGVETVIDGILDRKGHTRTMKDAQRMFNYNASGQVEYVALQTKVPYTGAAAAFNGFENYWNTANIENFAFMPFNHLDDKGDPLPPQALPMRSQPPTGAPAFESGMQTAFNQLMMVSGQWQNQMGMMGNERTGAAIDARTSQGDDATYHFQDNYEMALQFTGVQILDLIPKIYDTKRVRLIRANDGTDRAVEIDPGARQAYLEEQSHDGEVIRRVFNPMVGRYDIRATTGPAWGTRRKETVEALTLVMTQAPALAGVIGDLLISAMDFDEAQEAAQRLKRMVPPQALGQGPTPTEQQQQQIIQQLQAALAESLHKLGKEQIKLSGKDQLRDIEAYKAETDRMKALSDTMQLDQAGVKQMVEQLVADAAKTHLAPLVEANAAGVGEQSEAEAPPPAPPMPGARQAPDGEWYLRDPTRVGKFLRVAPLAQERRPGGVIANG